MKKHKLYILIFMLLIVGISVKNVYAYYELDSKRVNFQPADKTFKVNNVKDAIDYLYRLSSDGAKVGEENVEIFDNNQYQLPMFETYKWETQDSSKVEISDTGLASIYGDCDVYLKKEDVTYFVYHFIFHGSVLTFVSGQYFSGPYNNYYSSGSVITTGMPELLTDHIKGSQRALMLSTSHAANYIKFVLSEKVNITFSNSSYSDSAGGTGGAAIFSKVDANGNETEYITFAPPTGGVEEDYKTVEFEPGTYTLKSASRYLAFSEWTITSAE